MTLNRKAKIKTPQWIVWNALILWILKISGFMFVRIYHELYLQSWQTDQHIWKTLTCCFNSAFLIFNLIEMKKILFLFMLRKKFFVKSQFHKFLELFSKVY